MTVILWLSIGYSSLLLVLAIVALETIRVYEPIHGQRSAEINVPGRVS